MDVVGVVQRFGGQSALARLLGVRQSAISYWVKKSTIPSKWHSKLLELAVQHNVNLYPSDLMPSRPAARLAPTATKRASPPETLPVPSPAASQFLFYASKDGAIKVQVLLGDETVWSSQRGLAEIFDVEVPTIAEHLRNIYQTKELDEAATIRKFLIVQTEGGRSVSRNIDFYNLDAIISVGYRVNSHQATQFRKWATTVLREYLIKGFVLDDERLKQGTQYFSKDYFEELLERIRSIRASERRFYQKVSDIYRECSIDYDRHSPVTDEFYAHAQDKLHYAITGKTVSELIYERADASKPNMGLLSYDNQGTSGRVLKSDVNIGKNYLAEDEISGLNRLVSMFLDFAENLASRRVRMTMRDWAEKLDSFLNFNGYPVLNGYGKRSRTQANQRAFTEFERFRVAQDRKFESDYDKSGYAEIIAQIRAKIAKPTA